jgi:hypothetical protein
MLFQNRAIEPDALAARIAELIPEYLPGMDTGAAEPVDRRICWKKTLKALLSAVAKERQFKVAVDETPHRADDEQLDLYWKSGDAIALAASTGWGDRESLERRLQRFESLKAGQKLFIYTCSRWHEAVLEQINAGLLRYPLHLAGEQYIFANLVGTESKMHVNVVEIDHDGNLGAYRPDLLRPLKGSPFSWAK